MSLSVPLSVRVGNADITKQARSLAFRREAVGGIRSISFSLAHDLATLDGLDPLAKVSISANDSGEVVASGRLADTGRTAAADGQTWSVVAFGPAQHASDISGPLVYVDRSISDGWSPINVTTPEATISVGTKPGDTSSLPTQGFLAGFPEGITLPATLPRVQMEYRRVYAAGMKLARIRYDWAAGLNDGNWVLQVITGTNGSSTTSVGNHPATIAGGSNAPVVISQWANGHNTARLDWVWTGGASTAAANAWAWWGTVIVVAMRLDKLGNDITTGYTTDSVLASDVVADLLGRRLSQFDRANASIATTSFAINHLVYPDGVTAEQVLADMMELEPAYRWTTSPDVSGQGYGFSWELWPTTVRYEATLDDGGNFPISTQGLFNRVAVQWVGDWGYPRTTFRSGACPVLDDAGIIRQATISIGESVETSAIAAGDTFLQEHARPKNGGTLTVARPIKDVITGAQVQPWEIEAGELVRIRGVEAYPDAFNAADNDGNGVFRIHAVDYTTEGNVATLALDSDPRETEDALALLLRERSQR